MTNRTSNPAPLDASFTAAIQKDGAFPTYLELVGSEDLLGTRRAVKVAGTLDGHPFEATSCPRAGDPTGCRCGRGCARPSARPTPVSRSTSTCGGGSVDQRRGARRGHVER